MAKKPPAKGKADAGKKAKGKSKEAKPKKKSKDVKKQGGAEKSKSKNKAKSKSKSKPKGSKARSRSKSKSKARSKSRSKPRSKSRSKSRSKKSKSRSRSRSKRPSKSRSRSRSRRRSKSSRSKQRKSKDKQKKAKDKKKEKKAKKKKKEAKKKKKKKAKSRARKQPPEPPDKPGSLTANIFRGGICNISPKSELIFVQKAGEAIIRDVVTITNTHSTPLAFKIMCTAPQRYRVEPGSGLIPLGTSQQINIVLHENQQRGKVEDKFLIMCLAVSFEVQNVKEVSHKWTARAPGDRYVEHRLYCLQDNLPKVTKSDGQFEIKRRWQKHHKDRKGDLKQQLKQQQKESEQVVEYLIAQQLDLENSLSKMFKVLVIFGFVALIVIVMFVCLYTHQLYHSGELLLMCDASNEVSEMTTS